MKLIYLYHSGFALLGEGYTLIFDYFEDSVSADKGIVHEQLLSREGQLYVFPAMHMPTTLTGRYSPGKRFGLTSSICFQPTFLFLPETKKTGTSIHWRKETPIVTNISPCGLLARRT